MLTAQPLHARVGGLGDASLAGLGGPCGPSVCLGRVAARVQRSRGAWNRACAAWVLDDHLGAEVAAVLVTYLETSFGGRLLRGARGDAPRGVLAPNRVR